MSRSYEMYVEVKGVNEDKVDAVKEAANALWQWEDWYVCSAVEGEGNGMSLSASGRSSLVGGQSEEEFARELREAIWKANSAFCAVTVAATYLEELPHNDYQGTEDEYEAWVGSHE